MSKDLNYFQHKVIEKQKKENRGSSESHINTVMCAMTDIMQRMKSNEITDSAMGDLLIALIEKANHRGIKLQDLLERYLQYK